jgi:hypothetical protein
VNHDSGVDDADLSSNAADANEESDAEEEEEDEEELLDRIQVSSHPSPLPSYP